MFVCCECKREMRCDKNAVGADFGHGHVYPGDRFICDGCGMTILTTNARSVFDPAYDQSDEYLRVIEKSERESNA